MDSEIIVKAIKKINPDAKCGISGGDVNSIEWREGTTPIPVADIEAQYPAVEFDIAMEKLRFKRDKDLLESDWTQLGDTTLTNDQKQAWMRFRTELRDITKGLTTVDDVNNLDYPDKPNG